MRDYNKDGNIIPDSTDTDTKDHVPDMEKEVSDVISGLDFKEMVSDNREDASSDPKENITVPDTDTEDDSAEGNMEVEGFNPDNDDGWDPVD